MKNGIFFLLLFSYISICSAFIDFAGTYKCKGTDPYLNKEYSGTIKIIHQNTVYRLEMHYDDEDSVGTGGLFNQDTLAVVFQNTKKLKLIGLERYAYSDDHKIIYGYWVYLGKDKLGKEVCEKVN
jgi:hypothetical protein